VDWDDLRFFLELLRRKTLSAAAQRLNVTQSTVSRRLQALETKLGVRLVHRVNGNYIPTLAGEAIREHVERAETEMRSVERVVGGLDARLKGTVRVHGPAVLTSHILAPCCAALNTKHSSLTVELCSALAGTDALRHEADIGLQLRRVEQHGLVARRIGTLAFGLYASLSYLSHHGEPEADSDWSGHHLVTMVDEAEVPTQAGWLAEAGGHARVLLRTDNRETQFWAAMQGAGLALLPRFRGDAEPALRRLPTPSPVPGAEVWLAAHEGQRNTPRIRTVLDCIAEAFKQHAKRLDPGQGDVHLQAAGQAGLTFDQPS